MKPHAVTLSLCFLFLSCSKEVLPTQTPLEGENGITAGYKLDAVEKLALATDSTLNLMSIETGAMNIDGTSRSWQFMYCTSLMPPRAYYFTATFCSIVLDSISTRVGVGSGLIRQKWINSSDAARIAESMGGRAFRSGNPECSISAHLGEPVVPDPIVSWWIMYSSNTDAAKYQLFTVDARALLIWWN
jgi:hypothetical protein